MEVTFCKLQIMKEQGHQLPASETILVAEPPFKGWPSYTGALRCADENERERKNLITHGLRSFSYLIPEGTNFRLCYLGELIKKHTTDENAQFIADLMLINGHSYSPMTKFMGIIRSI